MLRDRGFLLRSPPNEIVVVAHMSSSLRPSRAITFEEYAAWLSSPRASREAGLEDLAQPGRMASWLLLHEPECFRQFDRIVSPELLERLTQAQTSDDGLPITFLMREAARQSPEVGDLDVMDPAHRRRLLRWWLHRISMVGPCRAMVDARLVQQLNAPDPTMVGDFPVLLILSLLWEDREDLQQTFDISTREGRAGLLLWFLANGRLESRWSILAAGAVWGNLLRDIPNLPGVPTLCRVLLMHHAELRAAFPAGQDGAERLRAWVHSPEGQQILAPFLEGARILAANEPALATARAVDSGPGPAFEVIVGGAHDPTHDTAKDTIRAFDSARFAIVERRAGDSTAPRGRVSFLSLWPRAAASAFMDLGQNAVGQQFTIGLWGSDWASWPDLLHPTTALVDEIWAPSRFDYDAIAPSADVPVLVMPPPVSASVDPEASRVDLGMPDDRFVFSCVADFRGPVALASPFPVVEAFRAAFPGDAAALTVCIVAPDENPDVYRRLLEVIGADPRIQVVVSEPGSAVATSTVALSDAFVTLHRTGGPLRRCAQAMMMGKPVIGTDFGATTDLFGPDTSFRVGFSLTAAERQSNGDSDGQLWAEPDIDHAAWQMQRVLEDTALVRRVTTAARGAAMAAHGFSAVTARAVRRLRTLGLVE